MRRRRSVTGDCGEVFSRRFPDGFSGCTVLRVCTYFFALKLKGSYLSRERCRSTLIIFKFELSFQVVSGHTNGGKLDGRAWFQFSVVANRRDWGKP